MNKFKKLICIIIGDNSFNKLRVYKQNMTFLFSLIKNFYIDFKLYYKHSTVFKQDTIEKIEALIILKYHSLEKGLLHNNIRYEFGKQNIIELCKLLKREDVLANSDRTQFAAAYLVMCTYYELHQKNNIDISSYYNSLDYELFKQKIATSLLSVNEKQTSTYFENTNESFNLFSASRSSVRDFTGEIIPFETIEKVIEIAKTAPSVCNRQPVKVYYVEDRNMIHDIVNIQQGLKGYSDNISQLLIVASDRNYFYTVGERNQFYIDGGIFLMNLLYALHYYKIGACPAHWGMNADLDKKIMKLIKMNESEKVICLVPIGIPKDQFKTTLSLRRDNKEILKVVNKFGIKNCFTL